MHMPLHHELVRACAQTERKTVTSKLNPYADRTGRRVRGFAACLLMRQPVTLPTAQDQVKVHEEGNQKELTYNNY